VYGWPAGKKKHPAGGTTFFFGINTNRPLSVVPVHLGGFNFFLFLCIKNVDFYADFKFVKLPKL
jgi:hypothetical protein